ncbi:MAG: fbpA 2 [Herminiimonas sp.]|nr:fbpA 2 [Herminiimonas sp.]
MYISKNKIMAVAAAAASFAFGLPIAAHAQSSAVAAVATYKGADRAQRILEGAKKEGKVVVYTSLENADATKLKAAFEKKYGIKLELWRSSSDSILSRVLTETRGNHFNVDVVETNGMELEALQQEKMLQAFQSPYLPDLIPESVRPNSQWIATRMHLYCVGYNTNVVKKENLPKTFKDLLNPYWKGKIGIEASNYAWFAAVLEELGERDGTQLFKNIVATNGISIRRGHNLLVNLVASGEVPLALTVNKQAVFKLKKNGAPIDGFFLQFGVGMMNGLALHANAPHPNAAALFADFMLSDGQAVLHELGREATAKRYQTTADGRIKMINAAGVLNQSDKWQKLYQDIIVTPTNQ